MTAMGRNGGRGNWHLDAACRAHDPNLFFPVAEEEAFEAKAICGGCSVRPDCLAFAFESRQRYGVWGGLSEKERLHLARDRSGAPESGLMTASRAW